jgi:hypothetical protein
VTLLGRSGAAGSQDHLDTHVLTDDIDETRALQQVDGLGDLDGTAAEHMGGVQDDGLSSGARPGRRQEAANDTSAVSVTPAVRPGAEWYFQ